MAANMTRARNASLRRVEIFIGFARWRAGRSEPNSTLHRHKRRSRASRALPRSAGSVETGDTLRAANQAPIAQASTSENTRVAKRFESVPALITPTDFRSSAYNAISFLNASPMG